MSRAARQRRLALVASVAAHLGLAVVLLAALGRAPTFQVFDPPPPLPVSLVPRPDPPPPPEPAGGSAAPAAAISPPPEVRPPKPAPAPIPPLVVASAPTPQPMPSLSDADVAGARTAGSGGGEGSGSGAGDGQGCDMVRRLQAALARDPEVRAAASRAAGGRTVLVWDGDWIRDPAQEGKGLAGVRQAIAMEVAFAPEGCRGEAMRGLVLFNLGDARLALGRPAWRWTDLLGARRR